MKQQERLELIQHNLRTRNIYRVRELLLENLSDFPDDKDFLMTCYQLAKRDPLILQPHDHELLEPHLERWDDEGYEELLDRLTQNFSQMRYYLGIQLSLYFAELKRIEREEELLKKKAEEEAEVPEEKKKKKIKIKLPKREKRKRSDKERHTLAGIHTTGVLLIIMIAQIIYGSKN